MGEVLQMLSDLLPSEDDWKKIKQDQKARHIDTTNILQDKLKKIDEKAHSIVDEYNFQNGTNFESTEDMYNHFSKSVDDCIKSLRK
ncbi:hypothetical protein [Litorilituus lipolyticus]|uniref:Uncharacterized protein n=1 Tax=Litorilituus lipolyticus TaxID=2491017 RepID=A0A502L847_9GAMM|nr:hypothetical protein [Litorilituus lipolyticus]TPH18491.1 hypothetical protein EPA86_01630 [Litorilituus lipolyticus]